MNDVTIASARAVIQRGLAERAFPAAAVNVGNRAGAKSARQDQANHRGLPRYFSVREMRPGRHNCYRAEPGQGCLRLPRAGTSSRPTGGDCGDEQVELLELADQAGDGSHHQMGHTQ